MIDPQIRGMLIIGLAFMLVGLFLRSKKARRPALFFVVAGGVMLLAAVVLDTMSRAVGLS
jgi:hypothetical protein